MIAIATENPQQPDVEALLRAGAEFALSLYPPEGCFLLEIDQLAEAGTIVLVARDGTGEAVGMVALVPLDDTTAEVKRLFVHDAARRTGAGFLLMDELERIAREQGIRHIVLETGTRHDAAQAFYAGRGYRGIPAFGQYVNSPFSVCMELPLD